MKELATYINEKLDIGNVNLKEFPITGPFEEVKQFLTASGFREMTTGRVLFSFLEITKLFNNTLTFGKGDRVFYTRTDDDLHIIYFGDTTKGSISKKNPLYSIKFEGDDNIVYQKIVSYLGEEIEKDEFLREINKHFKF